MKSWIAPTRATASKFSGKRFSAAAAATASAFRPCRSPISTKDAARESSPAADAWRCATVSARFAFATAAARDCAISAFAVTPRRRLPQGSGSQEISSGKLKFVRVPAGKFVMGSPPSEAGRQDQEKVHEVEISKPFFLSTHAVTQDQYNRVMGSPPSHFCPTGSGAAGEPGVRRPPSGARSRCVRSRGAGRPGSLQDGEGLLGGGQAVGDGVELGAERAQRQVRLGGEDEGEQPGPQAQVAVGEAQADLGGDERHGHGGDQLKGEAGQEREPIPERFELEEGSERRVLVRRGGAVPELIAEIEDAAHR